MTEAVWLTIDFAAFIGGSAPGLALVYIIFRRYAR
jgi:hypothetical protein